MANIELTIIVDACSESIRLHKTLRSVEAAAKLFSFPYELILCLDNSDAYARQFVRSDRIIKRLKVKILSKQIGHLGKVRNQCVRIARGKYVAFVSSGQLISRNWLIEGCRLLAESEKSRHALGCIAHTEAFITIYPLYGEVFTNHSSINADTDSLLSVYANRWRSVIMANRQLLMDNPYPTETSASGIEDWVMNCRNIDSGICNLVVPHTAVFTHHYSNTQRCARRDAQFVASDIFDFHRVKAMQDIQLPPLPKTSLKTVFMRRVRPHWPRVAQMLSSGYMLTKNVISAFSIRREYVPPTWIQEELKAIHNIENSIFFHASHRYQQTNVFNSNQVTTGWLYRQLLSESKDSSYDYILFLPWIVPGGADKYSLDYANTLASKFNKRVLVIATLDHSSPWASKLHPAVTFMPFGRIVGKAPPSVFFGLMGQVVANSRAAILHNINSEAAFRFLIRHERYVVQSGKKVIVSAFSQGHDSMGRTIGYAHTHVPDVYQITDLITTDNYAIRKMWIDNYGFDARKIVVHRQALQLPRKNLYASGSQERIASQGLRVLWAARVCAEKQPDIVLKIGRLLPSDIHIDMYGEIDKSYRTSFLRRLPRNVRYLGAFSGFGNLPLGDYDVYLYTSLYDGMPNALLEAGSYAFPVVASDVGGIAELIDDHTGYLIDDPKKPAGYAEALGYIKANYPQAQLRASKLLAKIKDEYSQASYEKNIASMLEITKH